MRTPRLRFTVRRMMVVVAVAAALTYLCVPRSEVTAIRVASQKVRAIYPGIDLAEYDILVGGPDRWHPCVCFRHKDDRSGLNVILGEREFSILGERKIYIGVHNDGPPPRIRR